MKHTDDSDIRSFLSCYEVSGPNPMLVDRTKRQMRVEALRAAAVPASATQEKGVFILVGLTLAMSLCLFYMLTVGTILRFVLPVYLLDYLRQSLLGLTAAGCILLGCALMMLVFKHLCSGRAGQRLGALRL